MVTTECSWHMKGREGKVTRHCKLPRGHRSTQSLLDYPVPSAELGKTQTTTTYNRKTKIKHVCLSIFGCEQNITEKQKSNTCLFIDFGCEQNITEKQKSNTFVYRFLVVNKTWQKNKNQTRLLIDFWLWTKHNRKTNIKYMFVYRCFVVNTYFYER